MTTQQRPIVHLFIGLHKTGSTALRFMLDVHRDAFARFGFHVPKATWTQTINGFFNGGHNNIAWEVCGNRPTAWQVRQAAQVGLPGRLKPAPTTEGTVGNTRRGRLQPALGGSEGQDM